VGADEREGVPLAVGALELGRVKEFSEADVVDDPRGADLDEIHLRIIAGGEDGPTPAMLATQMEVPTYGVEARRA
jgi:hypothetical protein